MFDICNFDHNHASIRFFLITTKLRRKVEHPVKIKPFYKLFKYKLFKGVRNKADGDHFLKNKYWPKFDKNFNFLKVGFYDFRFNSVLICIFLPKNFRKIKLIFCEKSFRGQIVYKKCTLLKNGVVLNSTPRVYFQNSSL